MVKELIQSTRFSPTDLARSRQLFQARLDEQFRQVELRRQQTLAAVLAACPPIIAPYPSITAAYVFGSLLRPGSFRANSDIDIAVMGLEPRLYATLWRELEVALPDWCIDLRELPEESTFTTIVKLTGRKIYACRDTPFTSRN